jgi:hypothetical protein
MYVAGVKLTKKLAIQPAISIWIQGTMTQIFDFRFFSHASVSTGQLTNYWDDFDFFFELYEDNLPQNFVHRQLHWF